MPKTAFSVRTDHRILRRLDKLAKQQERSRDDIVNEAIANFLELYSRQDQRVRAGIDAADQARFAGTAEMERVFGKYGLSSVVPTARPM